MMTQTKAGAACLFGVYEEDVHAYYYHYAELTCALDTEGPEDGRLQLAACGRAASLLVWGVGQLVDGVGELDVEGREPASPAAARLSARQARTQLHRQLAVLCQVQRLKKAHTAAQLGQAEVRPGLAL